MLHFDSFEYMKFIFYLFNVFYKLWIGGKWDNWKILCCLFYLYDPFCFCTVQNNYSFYATQG